MLIFFILNFYQHTQSFFIHFCTKTFFNFILFKYKSKLEITNYTKHDHQSNHKSNITQKKISFNDQTKFFFSKYDPANESNTIDII